jgi:hypothetical protein
MLLSPRDARRLVADISDFQGKFDERAYASAGHMVLALKAGEGNGHGGARNYAPRADRAHAVNCAVFHYWFCHPEEAHESQMNLFWDTVRPHFRKGDALVLDIEIGFPHQAGIWGTNAYRYLAGRSGGGDPSRGHHAIGYTYEAFLADSLQIPNIWLAAYRNNRPRSNLGGGRKRVMWQYTDGIFGPFPHGFAGIGQCDGSLLNPRFARQIAKTIGR